MEEIKRNQKKKRAAFLPSIKSSRNINANEPPPVSKKKITFYIFKFDFYFENSQEHKIFDKRKNY